MGTSSTESVRLSRMTVAVTRSPISSPTMRRWRSSARGAMKGWVAHGVCLRASWPDKLHGPQNLTPTRTEEARLVPGGAYYRVQHRSIRDMHAALFGDPNHELNGVVLPAVPPMSSVVFTP